MNLSLTVPPARRRTVAGGGREGRLFTASLRLADVDHTAGYTMMQGRAAPYGDAGNRWFFREVFANGLFDKSIKESAKNLPLLLFHDDGAFPIGSAVEWRSEPDDGLYGTWQLDGSAEAQRAAQLAADGHLNNLSVGYQPVLSDWQASAAEEWDPDDFATLDTVTRIEARLLETSVVPVPLFPRAEVTLVASAERTSRRRRHRASATPMLDAARRWRSTMT